MLEAIRHLSGSLVTSWCRLRGGLAPRACWVYFGVEHVYETACPKSRYWCYVLFCWCLLYRKILTFATSQLGKIFFLKLTLSHRRMRSSPLEAQYTVEYSLGCAILLAWILSVQLKLTCRIGTFFTFFRIFWLHTKIDKKFSDPRSWMRFARCYATCRGASYSFCHNWLGPIASAQSWLDRNSMSFFGMTPRMKNIFSKINPLT